MDLLNYIELIILVNERNYKVVKLKKVVDIESEMNMIEKSEAIKWKP